MSEGIKYFEEIRLSSPKPSRRIDDFLDEFWKISDPHPFSSSTRILHNASIKLYPVSNKIHLEDIKSLLPNSGSGTKAMKRLISLADKHSVVIEGFAKAYSDDERYITNTNELVRWYKKLGFWIGKRYNDGVEIEYRP